MKSILNLAVITGLILAVSALLTDRVRICQNYNLAVCGPKCTCCCYQQCENYSEGCSCKGCIDTKVERKTNEKIQQLFKFVPKAKPTTRDRSA
jgi:hypothetical protein